MGTALLKEGEPVLLQWFTARVSRVNSRLTGKILQIHQSDLIHFSLISGRQYIG